MKKKKQGFTLIELLAVIVILGLLMAIAIPSVTKYITQSRKKALTTTIGNYIGALTNQVNDMEYIFTASNTVYAVPIECIALERGGTDPFGEWYQANKSYWAYVLVQYDDKTSSYTYGFTFKDSAGYGLYPTTSEKLNESGSQINTDLDLTKPSTGNIEKITNVSNWNGFDVNDDTELKVLKSEVEGTTGNGTNTCTLCQKGKNYNEVNYQISDINKPNSELPILMEQSSTKAFWQYREQIKIITFEDSINIPEDAFKSWDVSSTGNGMVMAYIIPNATDSSYYDLYIQGDERLYANPDSARLFQNFKYVENINGIELFNTNKVTSMYHTFAGIGENASVLNISGLEKWNTSNVTNMAFMFQGAGRNASTVNINGLDKWDTSNVNNMTYMFHGAGANADYFSIGDLSDWDTSNVTNMGLMFCYAGCSTTWHLDCSKWNVNKVTSYGNFNYANTSNVIPPKWVN